MARAAFEALSYALRLPAELALNAGFAISSIRTTGGTGRSDFLCGLKAAVLNIAIEVPEVPDSELVGDAAAAAVALGEHPDLASASRAMARVARRHEPDPRLKSLYDENFGLWKEALGALAHVDARIAAALASRGSEN
jgi:sugar (pentulose or hexulose) kinase